MCVCVCVCVAGVADPLVKQPQTVDDLEDLTGEPEEVRPSAPDSAPLLVSAGDKEKVHCCNCLCSNTAHMHLVNKDRSRCMNVYTLTIAAFIRVYIHVYMEGFI